MLPRQAAPDTATFRAVLDSVFAGPAYRWVEEPGLLVILRRWWHELGDWLQGLQADNPAAFRVLFVLMIVLLAALLLHAGYVALQTVRGAVQMTERDVDMPSAVTRDAAWFRRAADDAAARGRWHEALQLGFAALALTLDAQGALRYHPSMTPAECAAAARLSEADRARLGNLVRALYAHVFGGRPCTADDYARWRATSEQPWHASPL